MHRIIFLTLYIILCSCRYYFFRFVLRNIISNRRKFLGCIGQRCRVVSAGCCDTRPCARRPRSRPHRGAGASDQRPVLAARGATQLLLARQCRKLPHILSGTRCPREPTI
ncbi:unnamed protein product [Diatraea saccharalis]|uniref:Uncharacterized protein n=1 Tax=Diatraea saccharalis TaxID=40085 RepID=A0A9N9QT19_9NEOP|nr:unnamed protein product [Diatraea saccharalis]